jgi:plasmid stability protein
MTDRKPMQLRLPPDLKAWLRAEAARNGASQNSEIIRALRAAKDRVQAPDFHTDNCPANLPADSPAPSGA